jgi:hypothetical protein
MKSSRWNHLALLILFLIVALIIIIHIFHWVLSEKIINKVFGTRIIEGAGPAFLSINPIPGIDKDDEKDIERNNGGDWADKHIPDAEIVLATKDLEDSIKSIQEILQNIVPNLKIPMPENPKIPMQPIRDAARDIYNPLIQAFTKTIPDWFHTTFEVPVEKIIADIKGLISNIRGRFKAMGNGLQKMEQGVGQEWDGIASGLGDGVEDIFLLSKFSAEYVFSYFQCGANYIEKVGDCWIYYFVEIIAHSLYLLPSIMIQAFYLFGVNLYPHEAAFWKSVKDFDTAYLYNNVGWGLTQWPKSVKLECYSCSRKGVRDLKDQSGVFSDKSLKLKSDQVKYDFSTGIKNKMRAGINTFSSGSSEFKGAFSSDFKPE